MSTIFATIGTQDIKINLNNADLLASCLTPHMREGLKGLLETHVAKAGCNHGSLKIGDKLIETGVLPPAGRIARDELRASFVSAIEEKAESFLSDYMTHASPIDYSKLPGGGVRPESLPTVRQGSVDPKCIPDF